MATATNSRRDLYASSEPRPKDSTKKRAASPHKKSPMNKTTTKRPKKELSQEEISLLTYQSISLLLDAARTLDEAEKKAIAKAAAQSKPVVKPPPVEVVQPPVVPVVQPAPIQPIPILPTPVVALPVTPQAPPRSPAKLIYDETPTSSSISAAAALTLLTESPPRSVVVPDHHLLTTPPRVSYPAPITTNNRDCYLPSAYRVVQAVPRPGMTTKVIAPITRDVSTDYYMPMPTQAVVPSMTSPAMPQHLHRHPTHHDTVVPMRHSAAIPIPAELADIAVPVAPRSVPSMPRKVKATRRPQKSHLPPATKRKGKTLAQFQMERERAENYGYPNECRTRIPPAVYRYRAERMKKAAIIQEQDYFSEYYWK